MASLEERVQALENLIVVVLDNIGETRKAISEGFKKTDENFTKIHEKIDALSGDTSANFENVDLHLLSIQEEISKINQVTGYEEAITNLRIIRGNR